MELAKKFVRFLTNPISIQSDSQCYMAWKTLQEYLCKLTISKYIKMKKNHSILPFKGTQTILRSSYQNLLTTIPKVLSQTVEREMGPWELGGNWGGKAALQWSRAGSVNGDQTASPVFNHIKFLFSDFKRGSSPPTVLDAPGNCLWTVTHAKKFPFFFFLQNCVVLRGQK